MNYPSDLSQASFDRAHDEGFGDERDIMDWQNVYMPTIRELLGLLKEWQEPGACACVKGHGYCIHCRTTQTIEKAERL